MRTEVYMIPKNGIILLLTETVNNSGKLIYIVEDGKGLTFLHANLSNDMVYYNLIKKTTKFIGEL